MRVGLIADIHGNLAALEVVLGELVNERVDRLVCLGDVAALGPRPAEVVGRLRELNCPSVLGNTDAWLLGIDPPDRARHGLVPLAEITDWAVAQLSDADWRYLRECPLTLEVPLGGTASLLAFHGSPHSYDDVIVAGTPPDEVQALFAGYPAAFRAGGHTHRQLVRRDGEAVFINPGGIGLPATGPNHPLVEFNQRVTWAEYAILDVAGERVRIDLRRVPLDVAGLFADAEASGMSHLDWWRGLWARPVPTSG